MRINDGSICGDCSHFEHDCDYDRCFEYCNNEDEDVKENFYENDDEIKVCIGFKNVRR